MEDSLDSELGSLNRRDKLQNGSNVLSPTKSSSTSEEEGQFDEGRRAAQLQRRNLQQTFAKPSTSIPSSSSAPTIAPSTSTAAIPRAQSPLHSRRQTSASHSDYWRGASETVGEKPTQGNLAARIRGYEGESASSSASRWGAQREERRPYYATESRRRVSPQAYRAFDEHPHRSSSTGAHDERYREHRYSPAAGRYDERDRDREREWEAWERDADRDRWEREREWELIDREREREREWTRPSYGRTSSPTHFSSAAAGESARAYSGTWSGPASPSTGRRDRHLSGTAWDRDRERAERERYDRERERWRYNSANEEPVPGRYAHSRTSPLRESRESPAASHWGKRGSAPHLRRTKTASSPSAMRSPEQGRDAYKENHLAKRQIQQYNLKSTSEEEGNREQEVSSPLDRLQESAKPLEDDAHPQMPQVVQVKSEVVAALPQESLAQVTPISTEVKLEETSDISAAESTMEDKARMENDNSGDDARAKLTGVEKQPSTIIFESPAVVQAQDDATDVAVSTTVMEVSLGKEDICLSDSDVLREDKAQVGDIFDSTLDVRLEARSTAEPKVIQDGHLSKGTQEMEIVADVSMDTTEELDTSFPPHLDLNLTQLEGKPTGAPLPTPRTKEHLEMTRRMAIAKMIQQQRPLDFVVAKVIQENRKALITRPHKSLESAIHGEYPRKNHIEPWLDDEDEEIQSMRRKMMRCALNRQKRLDAKIEKLRSRYRQLNRDWQRHCTRLDRISEARESQNRAMGYATSGMGSTMSASIHSGSATGNSMMGTSQPQEEPSVGLISALHPSMTRANRRNTQTGFAGFGDAVRSEAEFLEILATLENADMQDPNMRAARTTATEPEMIINPDEKKLLLNSYDDDNGFVADPIAFYNSEFDPDYWTEEEKTIFERRYALFPKQFGKIAASLPHKSSKQCVAYYYLTKHNGPDYKGLSAARNRDRKKKSRVKPKKGRGSALMADLKGDDVDDDDQGSPGEILADGHTTVSLGSARKASATSRARMLTTSTASGELTTLAEEEEGGDDSIDYSVGGSRKRRMEDTSTEDVNKRGNSGSKTKRSRSEKKGRANSSTSKELQNMAMPKQSPQLIDPDMAAAEALGALAGGILPAMSMDATNEGSETHMVPNRRNKSSSTIPSPSKAETPGEEGIKRSRQTTSSYWSVAERNEFLRSLAVYEKDWDAIAATLSTKSAAQARNYYARNAEEADFVEAATLAKENAGLSLAERQREALAFIQRRSAMQSVNDQRIMQQQSVPPQTGYFASGNSTARGLNINSLLNTDDDPSARLAPRRASMNEWFNKEAQDDESNDDTEEEDQQMDEQDSRRQISQHPQYHQQYQRQEREPSDYFDGVGRSSRYVNTEYVSPVGHPARYPVTQLHRHSNATLSSMPPPSAFLNSSRYGLPNQRLLSDNSRSPLAAFHYHQQQQQQQQQGGSPDAYQSQQQQSPRYAYDRDSTTSNTRGGWSSAASTPPSVVAQQPYAEQQRHASWPNVHSPAHLGPVSHVQQQQQQQQQQSFHRGDTSSLSPYGGPPRSSSATFQGITSSARSPFERPQGGSNGSMSSIRSLSPLPPSQYQQQQQQSSQQQQQAPLPRLPPINQSLFSARRDSTDSPH